MQPEHIISRALDRQATLARPILLALALVEILQHGPASRAPLIFVTIYLAAAILLALGEQFGPVASFHVPLLIDVGLTAAFLFIAPSVASFWCLLLFMCFAAGTHWKMRSALLLGVIFTLAFVVRTALQQAPDLHHILTWIALAAGTMGASAGMAYFGEREQRQAHRQAFLEQLNALIRVEKGFAETIRVALTEIARHFDCQSACLALRDEDAEHLYVWKVNPGAESSGPLTLPLIRADAFLADDLSPTVCWNSLEGPGQGMAWDTQTGIRSGDPPRPPASLAREFGAKSLVAATLVFEGRPSGRLLLFNRPRRFSRRDVGWFAQIVRHISPAFENVYFLRNLRARAVEAERSRISRDLHDGILQTLLSFDIRLDVLRHNPSSTPGSLEKELEALQKIARHEHQDLRRMVTDLRPLRIESADLPEMMLGFAERFRNESTIAVDLFLDARDLRVPDRVCREIFQIYRESLNNIKKHAQASHVVVKLGHDEDKLSLVVDDNGLGFSFSGTYKNEQLDELRLGPISIKERTRSVGGTLTVESNPGHGARLTVEIPMS
ncbi:MAG: GAF domain-containing sensor histidine kinase [Candidatus Acidiferrales bacterium]